MILELVQSICLFALVVAGYAALRRQTHLPASVINVAIGITFGLGAILAMMMTVTVAPGVIIDGRTAIASLAAVFGGVPGAIVAGAMAGGYRLWLGGTGALSGALGILGSCVAGLVFSWILRRGRLTRSLFAFWILGLAVVTQSLLTFFVLDWSVASPLIGDVAVPLYIAIPLGTAILGWVLSREDRWAELQRQLRDQTGLMKTIFNSMSDGLTVANDKGEIVLTNPASERLAGVRPNTVPAEQWAERFGLYKADGVSPFPRDEMPLVRAIRGEATDDVEMIVENAQNGRRRLLSISGRPLVDPDGVSRGGVAVFRDTTEHKALEDALLRSERRLRDAIQSINEGFALFDQDLRYVIFNQHLLDMYPISAPAVHVGARVEDVLRYGAERGEYPGLETPSDIDAFIEAWMKRLRAAEPVSTEGAFADGRWALVSHHRTTDGGYVTIRADITEQKRREGELREAYIRLERQAAELRSLAGNLEQQKARADMMSREKSQFLANMSHELRTPLNAILGFSDLMRHGVHGPVVPDRYREYVDLIHSSGAHLLSLINDVLDISKIEAGKMVLNVVPLSPADLVRQCAGLVSGLVSSAQLALDTEIGRDCATIHADERAVKQIIVNLLSNAIKFTPPGGRIRLSIDRSADGGVDIAVTDTGIGMKPQDIEKALRPFEQVCSPSAPSVGGTGLGLPLSRSLAELHGGSMHVTSAENVGTTVVVHLPDMAAPGVGQRLAATGRRG